VAELVLNNNILRELAKLCPTEPKEAVLGWLPSPASPATASVECWTGGKFSPANSRWR